MDTKKVAIKLQRQESARKGRETYKNKLKESILNDGNRVVHILVMQVMMLLKLSPAPSLLLPVLSLDVPMSISMKLVQLLC